MAIDTSGMLRSLDKERDSAYMYRVVEKAVTGPRAALFADLRAASEKQAGIWETQLSEAGVVAPPWRPSFRVRCVESLVCRLGPLAILPVLFGAKVRGLSIFRGGEGRSRGQESWHRASSSGGALRAAVFGGNDGLVSNASLILGVAGADPDPGVVLLAGVAGLLAGGFSMAAGEYISVRTQRELMEHQIELEKNELATMPEEEIEELTIIYEAKGLEHEEAARVARRIVSDPVTGLDTLVREELGLDPAGLASPFQAAFASFLSFAVGALLPLLPYLLVQGSGAFIGTIVVTEISLLAVGASMSLFTGRNALWSAFRQALIGSLAAAATYFIGSLLGVSLS